MKLLMGFFLVFLWNYVIVIFIEFLTTQIFSLCFFSYELKIIWKELSFYFFSPHFAGSFIVSLVIDWGGSGCKRFWGKSVVLSLKDK